MNFLDLLNVGIEIQMSTDGNFVEDSIVFRFRKGDMNYQRIIKKQEMLDFNGGGISSSFLEDRICRDVMDHFQVIGSDNVTLQIGQQVICAKGGVVGRICALYTPIGEEEQIMVITRDGQKFNAPAKLWKPYQFGRTATQVICDELATKPDVLLNPHGQYAAKFATNHGISINEALEHPTVKAHQEYLNKVEIDNNILLKTPGIK